MQKIDSALQLRQTILQLEQQQAAEAEAIKTQLHQVQQSLTPANLIKTAFKELAATQEVQDKMLTMPVALATGYVSKKLFEGQTHSTIRKVLGSALMMTITDTINRNPQAVRSVARGAFSLLLVAMRGNKPRQR